MSCLDLKKKAFLKIHLLHDGSSHHSYMAQLAGAAEYTDSISAEE